MKPTIFYADSSFSADGLFSEQDRQVSISIDNLNLADTTPYRVFVESECPEVRDLVQGVIDNHKFYDVILAWHERILRECPNAVKFVSPSAPWCGEFAAGTVSYRQGMQNTFHVVDQSAVNKPFEVSYLTSSKNWCPGHALRQQIFDTLPSALGTLKVNKHRSPPRLSGAERTATFQAQYHIAVENAQWNNYFTEKILDCFLMRTMPLYWGCPNLGEYFNLDGIMQFDTVDSLVLLLKNLTTGHYQAHRQAVEENYKRALEYTDYFSRVDSAIRKATQNESPYNGSDGPRRLIFSRTIAGQRLRSSRGRA